MSRYIDANLIGDRVSNGVVDYEVIKKIPTADVVEVVRCKDCSNWDKHWVSSLFSENVHYCLLMDRPCSGHFYCGAAEKRQVLRGDHNEV